MEGTRGSKPGLGMIQAAKLVGDTRETASSVESSRYHPQQYENAY